MSMKFHLPIGDPGLVSTPADANTYRQVLVSRNETFGGDNVIATYGGNTAFLPSDYISMVAMSSGVIHPP